MIIHNDDTIKIEYNEHFNSSAIPQNIVGATASTTLRTLDFTPSDDNSVFVSKTGSDSGAGTQADPVLTINKAVSFCTSTKTHVVILDDGTYYEPRIDTPVNAHGIWSAAGKAPALQLGGSPDVVKRTVFSDVDISRFSPTCCFLNDGNIFISWINSSSARYKVISNYNFSDIRPAQNLPQGTYNDYNRCCLTTDGNILIVGNNDYFMTYIVLSTTTWQVIYNSGNIEGAYSRVKPVLLDSGNILLYHYFADGTNNGSYYSIINGSTYALGARTAMGAINTLPIDVIINSDGALCFAWIYSNAVYFRRYTQSVIAIDAGPVLYSASGKLVYGLQRSMDHMVVMYITGAGAGSIYYHVLSNSYSEVYPLRYVPTGPAGVCIYTGDYPAMAVNDNGEIIILWEEDDEDNGICTGYFSMCRTIPAYIFTRGDFAVNGLKITIPAAEADMERLFLQGGNLTIKYTTVHNIPELSAGNSLAFTLNKGRYAFTFQNIFMRKNTLNMLLESDNVTVNQSIFYANRKNSTLEIDGAGAGISLTKNTFFNNYGAIKISNNDGNEIINNSIFHDNLNYDVNAETALTVNNSISTGLMIVAVLNSANCLQADPRFINDGFVDDEDLNLDIRLRVLGYPCDSPAYRFAADGKNAGAIDVLYNYVASTFDSCIIQKPDKFVIEYRPVGAVKNIMIDGTVNTAKQGQIIAVNAEWKGMLKEDWESLRDVWLKGKMVRLYPDPITHPEQYRAMRIEFSSIQGSTDYYGLAGDGNQGVKMIFAARYLDV